MTEEQWGKLIVAVGYPLLGAIAGTLVGAFSKVGAKLRAFRLARKYGAIFPFDRSQRDIEVRCSLRRLLDGENPPTCRNYIHSAEAIALQELASFCRPIGFELIVDSLYAAPSGTKNLLLLGLGAYNEASRQIMKIVHDWSFQTYVNKHGEFIYDGELYGCQHELRTTACGDDGESQRTAQFVTKDHGVIMRVELEDGRKVLLLGGIHMHGTLAAARIAMSENFHKHIQSEMSRGLFPLPHKRPNYIVQLVEVTVAADGFSVADIEWRKFKTLMG